MIGLLSAKGCRRFLAFFELFARLDEIFFDLCDVVKDQVDSVEVDLPVEGQVVPEGWQLVLVYGHDRIYGTLSNVQTRRMRKEIISDEEAEKDKVINDSLEVEGEGKVQIVELKEQIFPNHVEFDELEGRVLSDSHLSRIMATCFGLWALVCEVAFFFASLAVLVIVHNEGLSDDAEMRLMSAQAKHDQVCISTVHAVTSVWIVARLRSL